jgi:hypothetical protein
MISWHYSALSHSLYPRVPFWWESAFSFFSCHCVHDSQKDFFSLLNKSEKQDKRFCRPCCCWWRRLWAEPTVEFIFIITSWIQGTPFLMKTSPMLEKKIKMNRTPRYACESSWLDWRFLLKENFMYSIVDFCETASHQEWYSKTIFPHKKLPHALSEEIVLWERGIIMLSEITSTSPPL